ncbi:hypothetical protein ANN_11699 [Periplaneta americana]|uniref:Uncharacterized protein n=1 Tax=Periplaneta americana TaxID=6978 RepID=A0ABQ8T811_PERAM|nr:hypothetical protein ANN_11699 [Periplaneta americana]
MQRIATEHLEIHPAQVLRTELPRVESGILSQLPDRENLKKPLRRVRGRELPTEPINLEDLGEIPNCYKITLSGEFQKEQADTEASIAQLPLGQSVKTKPEQNWVRMNERIRNTVLHYNQYKENNRTLDYLFRIGYNFCL